MTCCVQVEGSNWARRYILHMINLMPTCFYLHLNLKSCSIQSSTVGFIKRHVSSVAPDDTNLCNRLLNGNYPLGCNDSFTVGAFNFHNEHIWISVSVHHGAPRPEKIGMQEQIGMLMWTFSL